MKKILLILFLFVGFSSYSQTSSDPDAVAFIAALNSDPSGVDLTVNEMNYITQMVEGMKSIGVWTKIVAAYPVVGGNAFKHKFNLKNPLDTDAAFRLTFPNGMTHSANGIQGNGTNQYANTFIVDNVDLPLNNNFLGYYNSNATALANRSGIGFNDTGTQIAVTNIAANLGANHNSTTAAGTLTSLTGFRMNYRVSSTSFNHLENTRIINFASTASLRSASSIYIMALNGTSGGVISISNFIIPFAIVGNAVLTDSEAQRLSHLIYYCQGILLRQ